MSDPPATVRLASPGDVETLVLLTRSIHELHAQAKPDYFQPYDAETLREWYREFLEQDEEKLWIASVDGVAVGFVSATRRVREANVFLRGREFNSLTVEPSFRRRGIGRLLLQAAIAEGRAQGFETVELSTWWFNEDARVAFQKLGFEPQLVRSALGKPG